MNKPFRTAAVLGAGIMGTQIAAHLANAGLTVHLLDLPAQSSDKNDLVETAFKKALKLSPPIFFTKKIAHRVILGNFEEHFHRVADVDWVIEAVVEKLDVKQQLMQQLETVIRADTIVSTNTSGLPIQAIAEGRSLSFRQRFLGTHFFNPPRYLKLLELIPTSDTNPDVLKRMQWFGRSGLGKGVVIAKDTPNFIANRIGMYAVMLGLQAWTTQGYTIEEIDALTGTLVGRPKSATFRTADLVGLDTLLYVIENLYPAIPNDESREVFRAPEVLRKLVSTGTLGAKTGQGFYKKQNQQILSLNRETFAYEPAKSLDLGDLSAIEPLPLADRLRALYGAPGRAGAFFRQTMLHILGYSARRIPEIANYPVEIDRAMRWGFGWELGPFEIWDVLGFETVLADMNAAHIAIPNWVETMHHNGARSFYWNHHYTYELQYQYVRMEAPADEINLADLKRIADRTLWQNSDAALLDLGDGVALYEFRSKGNTLSLNVVNGLAEVLDRLETQDDLQGLVIGNDRPNFCGGANLAEIAEMAQSGNMEAINTLIIQFQSLLQRIHYASKPIVAAVQGRVLGGGCELVMACPQVVAAAETYIGLVELSVGLIPGAGGILRTVSRSVERAATESPEHIRPFLQAAFETIATAKVSNSAYEGQELGFLPSTTHIVMNADRRLFVAKQQVLHLSRIGYTPPPRQNAILVLGRPMRAVLEHAAYIFQQSGFASDYDRYLANRLAYVMTGGELTAPCFVSEEYLLQLERETFLPLLGQLKTQERIAHALKTKKPLRN
ncbi:3-hydroxyacyl-CoA dehydrogenase/enoyl-CoA hydratase family protein [Thermocoleostomius sinensis]|uniref:3-hydroxyacyl-CoA dehydrogenase NAD-binding domain-containing protein n=1 Tax=Thermocoleostomius sinensis A174 TaxID=2016057 RepID=A0A9E8Z9M4_9CYAN|nr:3-hydroxyacyl-CoA dehydrogenase/enoyl-CoA hydratase family protein [Thermocoleostomius sinensis]WAL59094.1 3-hydroxyacyl-CoA dehydrogenase NAD-binding domain-containing protein [Thermocoleostomius sinensis A174]